MQWIQLFTMIYFILHKHHIQWWKLRWSYVMLTMIYFILHKHHNKDEEKIILFNVYALFQASHHWFPYLGPSMPLLSSHPLTHGWPGADRVSGEACLLRLSVTFDLIAINTCLGRNYQYRSNQRVSTWQKNSYLRYHIPDWSSQPLVVAPDQ